MASVSQQYSSISKVLVLLATYNGAPWLIEQVESILAQRDVDVTILIGDDLSKDGTRNLIQERWGGDARVRLHPNSHSSGSAGANFRRLYRMADPVGFDFVALADQDDIWAVDKLAIAVAALGASGAAGYSCAVTSFWPEGRELVIAQRAVTNSADFLFEGAGQGCTFVVTRGLFERVQSFCNANLAAVETLHYHDWLVYLLSRAWAQTWYFDATPHMRYRQHAGNEIGSRGGVASVTRRLDLVRNGWYRKQVLAAAEIYLLANAQSNAVSGFLAVLRSSDSIARRAKMALFCVANGRRRVSDRLVLVLSAAAGWL